MLARKENPEATMRKQDSAMVDYWSWGLAKGHLLIQVSSSFGCHSLKRLWGNTRTPQCTHDGRSERNPLTHTQSRDCKQPYTQYKRAHCSTRSLVLPTIKEKGWAGAWGPRLCSQSKGSDTNLKNDCSLMFMIRYEVFENEHIFIILNP